MESVDFLAGGNPTLQLIAQRKGLQLWLISGMDAFRTYLLSFELLIKL